MQRRVCSLVKGYIFQILIWGWIVRMYQALYRKWRPKTFDDVVGQAHITETLKHQVQTGRLSHAYLFIGTRGTGKTTCAKILAKAVNCEHPVNGNPCNQCAACRGIDDGSILDVVELDAASNNGVDNVRALRDEAVFSPANVKKRVYIIDEVHMLSTSAFNALLKILEEPPEHLMFILATTELHKVPATILSRCQRHSFKRIAVDEIASRLRYVAGREQIDLQDDAAALLARLADGGLRDALTLLDQCSGSEHVTTEVVLSAMGLAGHLRTAELLRQIAAGDTAQALLLFRQLWQDGKDPAALLDELCVLQRDVLMQTVAPHGGSELLSGGYDTATLDSFAKMFGAAQLLANIRCIQAALAELAVNPNPRMAAELCIIRLCRPELQDDSSALCARLERLEQMVQNGVAPAQPVREERPESAPPRAPQTPAFEERPPLPEEPPFEIGRPPVPEEPERAPIPVEAPPIAETLHPEPPASGGFSWDALCAEMEKLLPVGLYSFLLDPLQASGSYDGGVLTLQLNKQLAFNMYNTPAIAEQFRAAVQKLTGQAAKVVMKPMDTAAQMQQRHIEELARFTNVTIK